VIRGDVVFPSVVLQLVQPPAVCTCDPEHFPVALDADCPHHGLRALLEGRFDIERDIERSI
jgi:hypothetical protein